MEGLLPVASAEKDGLMSKFIAGKSLSLGPSPSDIIIKLCRLYKYEIATILLQWGKYTDDTFNVAIVYLNNRFQDGAGLLRRSISRLSGNLNVYYKRDDDNADIYVILPGNNYVRIDCAPIYNENIILLLEESGVSETDLTPLF